MVAVNKLITKQIISQRCAAGGFVLMPPCCPHLLGHRVLDGVREARVGRQEGILADWGCK